MSETKTVSQNRVGLSRPSMYRRKRRGAMTVLCAVSLIVLLAVAALIVDIAWISVIQTEAQVASDLAARSSLTAYMLDRSDESFAQRKLRAQRIGELVFESSNIGQMSVDIDKADIQLGVQTAGGQFKQNKNFANAALVDLPQVSDDGFSLFLAPIFGHEVFNTTARSKTSFTPIDVVLCVDMSRSMAWEPGISKAPGGVTIHQPALPGSRWLAAIDSINSFMDKAERQVPTLRAGLVTFGGGERKVVDTPWDDTASRAMTDIDLLGHVRGEIDSNLDFISENTLAWRTPTMEGLEDSLSLLQSQSGTDVQRLIILLSDGKANTGDPLPTAETIGAAGITIHTIYFSGSAGTRENMAALSGATGGLALTPDNAVELDQAFDQILALLSVQMVE